MRYQFTTAALLIVVTSLSALSQTKHPSTRAHGHTHSVKESADRKAEKENIREAVFRYQIKRCAGGMCKVVFLAVADDKSPSSALMARFASNPIPIKPISSAVIKDRLYKDRVTNEQGVLYYIRKINHVNASQSTVNGGWMSSPRGGIFALYTCKNLKGKWSVTSEKIQGEY